MGYITIAKYAVVVLIFIGYTSFIAVKATSFERGKWELMMSKLTAETNANLYKNAIEVKKATEEAVRLAQQIEVMANENKTKVTELHDKLVSASRVRERSVCVNNKDRMPKADSSGDIVNEAAISSELSREFKDFLISESLRADTVGVYAETAYQWIEKLCKTDQLACSDIPTD